MLPADTLVVLVDDDHAILHGMAELFDSWDIDLVAAPNAEDILHWLAGLARVPDVIVSDYGLPVGSSMLKHEPRPGCERTARR
jgi:CheY-like chemotaxis protein